MALKIFCAVPHLLAELEGTAQTNCSPTAQTFSAAEEFVCRLYNPFGDTNDIPSLRCTQFRKGAGKLENLPPTRDALRHHILRAIIRLLFGDYHTLQTSRYPAQQQVVGL